MLVSCHVNHTLTIVPPIIISDVFFVMKVILTDGDFSTLANMKVNLELNHLTKGNLTSGNLSHNEKVRLSFSFIFKA